MIIIPCLHLGLPHAKNSIAITSTNLDKKPEKQAGRLSAFHMRKLRHAEAVTAPCHTTGVGKFRPEPR